MDLQQPLIQWSRLLRQYWSQLAKLEKYEGEISLEIKRFQIYMVLYVTLGKLHNDILCASSDSARLIGPMCRKFIQQIQEQISKSRNQTLHPGSWKGRMKARSGSTHTPQNLLSHYIEYLKRLIIEYCPNIKRYWYVTHVNSLKHCYCWLLDGKWWVFL